MEYENEIHNLRISLDRLIYIAKNRTGQSLIVAEFLLSWWNAPQWGGFDLVRLWELDISLREHAIAVFTEIALGGHHYIDAYGYEADMHQIVDRWGDACRDRWSRRFKAA